MNRYTEMLVLTPLLIASLPGCQSSPNPAVSADADGHNTTSSRLRSNTATLWVRGLACPFCVHNVEKQLLRVPGVQRVNVVLETGHVTAALSETDPPSEHQLRDAIEDSGFTLDRIEMP